ncbi:MAG: AmmeMemoRadiSam system radical SAM enzyme [Firmicutes bacterium]|nr:AmmeMemoRadiSam system radical SAM enzyme [Bacillota bacterium]
MEKALYYQNKPDQVVQCSLCPRECVIAPERVGVCRVRLNRDGVLYTRNYGQCSSWAVDPIEKKPLYHFFPGHDVFSIGTVGCSFRCQFCQNWQIAQAEPVTVTLSPAEVVDYTLKVKKRNPQCIGIAYTYSEPLVWYEFVLATAKLAQATGLKNVLVTNGYIQEKPLAELLPYIDALNIDVKGFTPEFYRRLCGGELKPVLKTAEIARQHCHVEITTLLIPGLNDTTGELKELVAWVYSLGPETPLHFSRYYPNYKLELEPTPLATLHRARELAKEKLYYVYLGNVIGDEHSSTFCPQCRHLLIRRSGYHVELVGLRGRTCATCGREIEVII